jgi:hypothetical protein
MAATGQLLDPDLAQVGIPENESQKAAEMPKSRNKPGQIFPRQESNLL